MKRVLGYVRVSRDDLNADNQRLQIKKAIEANPEWTFVGFVVDEGVSGSTEPAKRLGWGKVCERVEEGSIDLVCVAAFDRISRRGALDMLTVLEYLKSKGVALVSLRENVDTSSAMGEMVIVIISSFARMERETLIHRTKAGLERAIAEGKKLGRPKVERTEQEVKAVFGQNVSVREGAKLLGVSRTAYLRLCEENGLLKKGQTIEQQACHFEPDFSAT